MAVDNSTSDPHTPRPQLSTVDIVIIAVYFALNVAVGIWVRGLVAQAGVGTGVWEPSGMSPGMASSLWRPDALGPSSQPWGDLPETLTKPLSLWRQILKSLK